MSARLNEKAGFVQDSEGKWAPRVNRRSSFETKGESPYFKGEYGKKEYKAGDYAKKSWQGGKSFETKTYQGETDGSRFAKSSRFDGQAAREGSQGAREGGQTAREGGNTYATGDVASTLTGLDSMERAVEAAGGYAARIDPSAEAIQAELEAGRTVIVAGTFDDPASPTGRKEGLWNVDSSVQTHIIAVTGVTSDGNFIVCDPANPDQMPATSTGRANA